MTIIIAVKVTGEWRASAGKQGRGRGTRYKHRPLTRIEQIEKDKKSTTKKTRSYRQSRKISGNKN